MLTDRMKKAAAAKSLEAEIAAHPVSELPTEAPGSNIILLGPQVGYMKDKITQEFPDIPVRVVDMRDYGMMNGEKVLQDALDMISP
jgi:PTS system cellobiose-specific IIB component